VSLAAVDQDQRWPLPMHPAGDLGAIARRDPVDPVLTHIVAHLRVGVHRAEAALLPPPAVWSWNWTDLPATA
jgi:hypothetical protein